MGVRIEAYRVRREDLTDCPKCQHGQQAVDPMCQFTDTRCEMCGGTGVVGPKCACGRPQILDQLTYLSNGVHTCGREECEKTLLSLMKGIDDTFETETRTHYTATTVSDLDANFEFGFNNDGSRWWERFRR